MAGNGNSGRKPRTLTAEETKHALRNLTRRSVAVIEGALDAGDVGVAKWVVEHVIGRAPQPVTGGDKDSAPIEIMVRRVDGNGEAP